MDKIISGKLIAEEIKSNVKKQIDTFLTLGLRKPKLAVILVGEDPASAAYVRGKEKDCREVGIESITYHYDNNVTYDELISKISELNSDNSVDGILVQLPLPKHFDPQGIISYIDPHKDVDKFKVENAIYPYLGMESNLPCTVAAILKILDKVGYNDLSGLKAVVVGRSFPVGKPLANMLIAKNATVTVCNSKTLDLKNEVEQADILISAAGSPYLIKGDWIKEGATVIDVGISRENGKLVGDVEFEKALPKVKHITPVPGGVGLVTRAMLMKNVLDAYMERE